MERGLSSIAPRVLIDGRALLDASGGGVVEYARRLSAALKASKRLDTEVWANAARLPPAAGIDAFTRYPNKLLNASMRAFHRPRLDRLSTAKPDACWMPNHNFLALSPGVPLALTVHDLTFETYPEFFSPKQRVWHFAVAPRRLARRSQCILAVSETVKSDLVERWRLPAERITVAHEGVAPEFFEPPREAVLKEARGRLRLPERFILHMGALEPRKNHLGLLEAYRQLRTQERHRGLGLVLAGPAGWKNGEIHRAIRQNPHRDDIRLLGYVSESDRRCLYRLAAVLAFPSFYEGFGLPPLEAMASGLPVVASHAGAISEIVARAGLLTDPYRPAEIAHGLEAVLDSPSLAGVYAERGLERAKQFSWRACAEKTEAALLDMLGR